MNVVAGLSTLAISALTTVEQTTTARNMATTSRDTLEEPVMRRFQRAGKTGVVGPQLGTALAS
ncbi:hypothetical protein PC116_g20332 [Phytophthora cactorum]|uniref:Uncharacterized protein n=1 Tax=Phytophthora cactorum TaxID=29920 RepID=A0A8T1A5W3_9STRA|nr:hypothetical protein PC112_g12498 [Phytophthora cactorum]KAG2820572.1 hypothetical protein PC111_g11415 [Phytophthora cactorum]KAG2854683.1 hypothetical protein PC113_g13093 [Phytophthora cactorum]KAG2865962.1 hypothetical protein PC114_g27973 [Phytophthora cactorum]KAG2873411.1 hypothetical protein PC117_g27813 [Phytophthora cactorum]